MTKQGYLYLIILRESIRLKESVLKFGCTKNVKARCSQYPKGSKLLFSRYVNDYEKKEKEILKGLCKHFIQRKDYGSEYFEGNAADIEAYAYNQCTLAQDIFEIATDSCQSEMKAKTKTPKEKLVNKAKESKIQREAKIKDPDLVIQAFIESKQEGLHGRTVKASEVYMMFLNWLRENSTKYKCTSSQNALIRMMHTKYGFHTQPHQFEDGIAPAIVFQDITELKKKELKVLEDFIKSYMLFSDQ